MFKKLGFLGKKSRKKTIGELNEQDVRIKEKDKLNGGQFQRIPGIVSNDEIDELFI